MATSDAPVVSVVVPTVGQPRHLAHQLDALAGQAAGVPFDVVVADNGCVPGALDGLAGGWKGLDLRVVDASARRNVSFARNQGARSARGRALLFLDDDDVVAAGYVDAMASALQHHRVVAARVDVAALNPPGLVEGRTWLQLDGLAIAPPGAPGWALGGTLGIDRGLFDEVGGFDESTRTTFEDVDLCWRLHRHGCSVVFVPEAVVHRRLRTSAGDIVRQAWRDTIGTVPFRVRYPEWIPRPRPPATWIWQFAASLLSAVAGAEPHIRAAGWLGVGCCLGEIEMAIDDLRARVLRLARSGARARPAAHPPR